MEKGFPKYLCHVWPLFRGFGWLYYAKLRWNRPKTKKAHISVWPNARTRCFDKLVLIWLCYPKNAVKCNSQLAQKHSATYRPPSHVKWDYCVPSTIYTIPSGNKTDNGTDSSGEKKTLAKGPTSVFNPMKICIGRSSIVFRINSISIIPVLVFNVHVCFVKR